MVPARGQPLLRMTPAALTDLKAANRTLASTPSARCLASVGLPVSGLAEEANIEARARPLLSQFEAAVYAGHLGGA